MAEEFTFDQILRQRGAVQRHKRFCAAPRKLHDRARHQLLAGAGTAPDQHGRVGGGDLPDQPVDVLHGAAVADQLAGVFVEHFAQLAVFLEQVLALLVLPAADFDRVGHDVADGFEQRHVALKIGFRFDPAVDAQSADHPLHVIDRHADECDRMVVLAGPGAVQEPGVLRDVRHQLRPAGLGDAAGDPLAEVIQPALHPALVKAVGGFNLQRVAVKQGDRAAQHPHAPVEHGEDFVQQVVDVALMVDHRVTDLLQNGDFGTQFMFLLRHRSISCCSSAQVRVADPFDRLPGPVAVAEGSHPEISLAAGAEAHAGRADHLTGV